MERTDYIETRKDVINNIKTLYSYLSGAFGEKHKSWAIGRMTLGHNYVVEVIDSRICFAPSRFVGYINNTKEKYDKAQGNGTQTDRIIKNYYTRVQDNRLDTLLQETLSKYKNNIGKGKKYWIPKDTSVDDIVKFESYKERYVDLLRMKHNIILQGAPGTGKTYNTAALALSICGEKIPESHDKVMERYNELQEEGRIGFCTFHQSMDYEDFVEGIKPKTDNDVVTYNVEDGIFKKMSKIARNPQQIKQVKSLDSAFDDLVQDINDGKVKSLKMKTGSNSADLSVSSQLNIKWKSGNGNLDVNCVSKDKVLKLCEVYDSKEKIESISNINEAIRDVIGGCNSSYYWAVTNYLWDKIDNQNVNSNEKPKNYVLIIDEINRGNVSRIFGELITLLEADKRLGGDHPIKVTLPYSKESFGVPSNLYIIGTMNTTDRSVGNIDYAVRRRFAFVTLESDRQVVVDKFGEESQNVQLFDAVESFIKKNKIEMDFEDLMVGHSYFFAKGENELAMRWQYEILPLLNEYIKDDIIRADRLSSDITIEKFVNENKPEQIQE